MTPQHGHATHQVGIRSGVSAHDCPSRAHTHTQAPPPCLATSATQPSAAVQRCWSTAGSRGWEGPPSYPWTRRPACTPGNGGQDHHHHHPRPLQLKLQQTEPVTFLATCQLRTRSQPQHVKRISLPSTQPKVWSCKPPPKKFLFTSQITTKK